MKPITMAKVSLDQLDFQILNILSNDAKRSYADIGKELDVSSGTIFVRVKKLVDQDIIKNSIANINYRTLGYNTLAFLSITVDNNSSSIEVSKCLINLNHVIEATPVSGNFNVLCKIVCPSTSFLGQYIENHIKKIEGISNIVSHIALDNTLSKSLSVGNIE